MRNTWYPRKIAEYQTLAQIKELGDFIIERDSTFNPQEMERERIAQEKREVRQKQALEDEIRETARTPFNPVVPIEPETPLQPLAEPEILSVRTYPIPFRSTRNVLSFLQHEQAASIVAKLIPQNIDFDRTPIPPPPPPRKISPSLAAASTLSAAAAAAATESAKRDSERNPQQPAKTAIYGSVSTADIAANLKSILVRTMVSI
jgi:hypothetical protein